MALDWASRKQGGTARNTPDAELTGIDEATHTSGLVQQEIFENLLRRPVRLIAETDNETAVAVVAKGYSRRLCYLRRTQRISISGLHDIYHGVGDAEEMEPSDASIAQHIPEFCHLNGAGSTEFGAAARADPHPVCPRCTVHAAPRPRA